MKLIISSDDSVRVRYESDEQWAALQRQYPNKPLIVVTVSWRF